MAASSKKTKHQKRDRRPRFPITGAQLVEAQKVAETLCEGESIELVHMESLTEHGHAILRLYIDKEGGVNLGDCTDISRQLGDLLDVSLNIQGEYRLEVSSPGLERPLSKPQDFERFKGSVATITTLSPMDGRSRFKGELQGLGPAETVGIVVDGETFEIALENIKRARLVANIGES
ncbi:MAG: ribosome maturation factor RimP [Desulfobacterales bacterium]|nr:ribosome maturation factor RimP [Desulfobacterales bacterium]